MPLRLSQEELLIINLLLRIAVMAGIVSLLLGFRFVMDFLMRASVSPAEHLKMGATFAIVFVIGVIVRRLTNQGAMDLSLEGALFAGFFGGVWLGTITGLAIGGTCYLLGEPLALPFYAAAGFASGIVVTLFERRREIWSYSLNPFSTLLGFLEGLFNRRIERDFVPFAMLLGFIGMRYSLLERTRGLGKIYGFLPPNGFALFLELLSAVCALGIALKMAGNARLELMLREEERQLMKARLATLRSQVNPHFLFNTLNSIYSLIRTDAERAREMTRQLASIFRKALDEASDTHSLREEIAFIDDYLAIEKVRFGEERLRIFKDLSPETLDVQVPVMILQPIVENAVKHGISHSVEGGAIKISAKPIQGGIEIEIENDGAAMKERSLNELIARGMGLRNVVERLSLYTCGKGLFELLPRAQGGAVARIFMPSESPGSVEQCQ